MTGDCLDWLEMVVYWRSARRGRRLEQDACPVGYVPGQQRFLRHYIIALHTFDKPKGTRYLLLRRSTAVARMELDFFRISDDAPPERA